MELKVAGIFTGLFIVAVPTIRWLISSWFKAKKELEDLKQSTMQKTIDGLLNQVEAFESCVKSLKGTLGDHSKELSDIDRRMASFMNKIDEAVKAVHYMEKNVENMVRMQVKTELLNLGNEASLIRGKQTIGD